MDSSERGMNPVTMTIINPQKNIGQAGGRTSDLFSSPERYRLNYGARPKKKQQFVACLNNLGMQIMC